ncbi:MAG: carbon starvation protein A [Armatimonadetes bacterium]|nr:carbon starvation protein A [Armatimonadota bacterium]
MNSLTLLIIALCVFALAYRVYGAFLAAKVAVLDPKRVTPAHEFKDGKDYHPTNKYVLFGHHFAAIAGAGPLVGPVLAAQYGYFPGVLWILIGAVFAGAVQDFIILFASVRHKGESISKIAEKYLGRVAGWCTAFATLIIIIVALAGLALMVVNALKDSSWGVFTIGCSIPIAFLMGQWMYKIRPGKVTEATIIGTILLLIGVVAGHPVSQSSIAGWFTLSTEKLEIALPVYGFIAAALPVWMLLCPRDYLSTYMKLGTIALLAVGIFIVHPNLVMPATTQYIHGGGPIIPGPVWPYVCITIACGAISGFHALIGSGTTPKMINNEREILPIGYGAMLIEGFVGLLALVAACTLTQSHYFAINAKAGAVLITPETAAQLKLLTSQVGEKTSLIGRTGGGVTLAVGMASIFKNIPGMKYMMSYWYHFVIMFEALFILTTIDTGTRVARFILQEMLGRVYKPLGKGTWIPGVIITSFIVSFSWYYLLRGGAVNTIWPMFGIANQLLGAIALAIGTTFILRRSAKRIYALTTFAPFVFMIITVLTAGVQFVHKNYGDLPKLLPADHTSAIVKIVLTIIMMILACIISVNSISNWISILRNPNTKEPEEPEGDLMTLAEGAEMSD